MTTQSSASTSRVRFAGFQRHLIMALCGVAFATLFPYRSSAQAVSYYDFNTPNANSGQTSTSCGTISGGPAASGILFCFNYPALGTDGLGYIQDFYPPLIDPNASTDSDSGSTNSALQITENAGSEDSSMWFSIPQNVLDGFTAWYTVKISHQANDPSNYFTADGFAFVIQNAAGTPPNTKDPISSCTETGSGLTVLGEGGGGLGYCGIDNSVALEMDTFWDDPYDPEQTSQGWMYDDNHMALQSCGPGNQNSVSHLTTPNCLITLGNGSSTLITNPITSAVSPATGSAVTLADGNPHQVVIIYNGLNDAPKNYLYVYLDPAFNPGTHTPVAGSVPLFSGPFDITNYVNLNNGTAYVGFTAATGGDWEQHEVMGFTFTPHNFASANVCPSGQTTPAPCSNALPVTFNFAATTTIGSVQVVTQGVTGLDFQLGSGSTCNGTIAAGNSCTVNVNFAPLAPGLRMGAVNLLDGSGNVLATRMIYGIGQGPAVAFGPGTQSTVNTTGSYPLNQPKGVAVDAAGDVFISDNDNQRVVKVATNGTVTTVGFNLQYPQGLAVDGAGDLFIADNNINSGEVLEVPAGCTNSNCQKVLISDQTSVSGATTARSELGVAVDGVGDVFFSDFLDGYVAEIPANGSTPTVVYNPGPGYKPGFNPNPVGLAVDAAGDLFVADFGLKEVLEIPAGCTNSGCWSPVGTGWFEPEALAVDAAGDVFVADEAPKVVEVPAGCTNNLNNCQITISGILAYGVAVDGTGNVFIPDLDTNPVQDPGSNQVVVINRSSAPALTYFSTTVGSTSLDSPQSFTIQNVGNQTLSAFAQGLLSPDPTSSRLPARALLPIAPPRFALTPGTACNLSISFTPQSAGNPLISTAVLTDNALNATPATQSVPLSGIGVAANYTLTVSEVGSGAGTVTAIPGPISCSEANGSVSGTCSGSYQSGFPVALTANATGTSIFLGWGGACATAGTNATCNVAISTGTGAANVSASFVQQDLGNINVCASGQTTPAPCSNSVPITFNIAANTTIGAIQVVTQGITGLDFALGSGSTCTGTIAAGSSCTVNVNFTPLAPGLRMGAVRLFDNRAIW